MPLPCRINLFIGNHEQTLKEILIDKVVRKHQNPPSCIQ